MRRLRTLCNEDFLTRQIYETFLKNYHSENQSIKMESEFPGHETGGFFPVRMRRPASDAAPTETAAGFVDAPYRRNPVCRTLKTGGPSLRRHDAARAGKGKSRHRMTPASSPCGKRGIRTPGASQLNGFQDRRNRPLCHLSATKV